MENGFYDKKLNDQWKGGSTNIRPPYYAKYEIDPWTFIIKNQLGMDVGSVIKYVVRHQDKNGIEDLNKAIKCLEMMKEHYYGEKQDEKEASLEDISKTYHEKFNPEVSQRVRSFLSKSQERKGE